ncbi:major Facilitator Superfamily protein, partial [Chlamydia psittaci C1/97]
TCC